MNSSTSNSEPEAPAPSSAPKRGSARTFLAAAAGGLLLGVLGFSFMDASWLHQGPEFGMSEAHQDHMRAACAAQAAPQLLILGDSRAVAGLSVKAIRETGVDADKYALGATGLFGSWAYLDRMLDCGVRPKTVLLAVGLINVVDTGAIMDRTTSFNAIRGPRAAYEYDELSKAETRPARKAAYKAISLVGPKLSGVQFTLLAPSLKRVLQGPAYAIENHQEFEKERANFAALNGDRYYGIDSQARELPQEKEDLGPIPRMNNAAIELIQAAGKKYGFKTYFYVLPSTEIAKNGLDPKIVAKARDWLGELSKHDVTVLNTIWYLPDDNFGDEGHVNPKGRAAVTADFLPRWPRTGHGAAATAAAEPPAGRESAASR